MATRRSRIKGIANIPQRRRPPAIGITPVLSNEADTADKKISVEPNLESNNVGQVNGVEQIVNSTVEPKDKEESAVKETSEGLPQPPETGQDKVTTSSESPAVSVPAPAETPSTAFSRRRIIKPAVSLRAIKTTPKPPSPEEPKTPTPLEKPAAPEDAVTDNCHSKILSPVINTSTEYNNNQNGEDKEPLSIQKSNCIVPGITELPPLQNSDKTPTQTDQQVEVPRPLPPTSPNKYANRARIKAVPRLGQRRTSFSIGSASESEDESRNRHRIRNDSVCSTTSIPNTVDSSTNQSIDITSSPQKKRAEFNTVIQRKCRRTEQSRKLAEARREFQRKFGTDTPDRQKLTMIDLIFYNPSGPGMSQKRKRKNTDAESILSNRDEEVDNPDDPPADPEQKEEEEDAMPAPQITIGADGQIIIDEKSLYIENKEVKKNRETLKNSVLIDGDSYEGGYGMYKKVKRSKDWGKMETLRFYKALNTIGTDFSLMCGLFPGRTRREIKMKFKKEERVNRALIDRAVMQPILYDITELQRDLEKQELEERRKKELEKNKKEFHEEVKAAKEKPATRKRSRRSIKPREKPSKENTEEVVRNKLHLGISSLLDSDDEPLAKKPNRRSSRNKSKENENSSELEQNNEANHERDIEEVLAEIHGEDINPTNDNVQPDKKTEQRLEKINSNTISLQNNESAIAESSEVNDETDTSGTKSKSDKTEVKNQNSMNQQTSVDKVFEDEMSEHAIENREVIDLDDDEPEAVDIEKDNGDIDIEKSTDVIQSSELANKELEDLNFDNVRIEIIEVNEATNKTVDTEVCRRETSTEDDKLISEMDHEVIGKQSNDDESSISIANQSSESNDLLVNEPEYHNSKVTLEETTIIQPSDENIAMIQEVIENNHSPSILKSSIKEQPMQSCDSSEVSDDTEMITKNVVKTEPRDTKSNLVVPFDVSIQMLKTDFEAANDNQEDAVTIEHNPIKKSCSFTTSNESNSNDSDNFDNISNMDECSNDMISEIIIEQTSREDDPELNGDTNDVVDEGNDVNANEEEIEENLEPGSIIVTSVVNASGAEVYTVYSVNEQGKKIPADIAPDVLEILLNSQKNPPADKKEQSDHADMNSHDNSLVLPSEASMDNIMADMSLSNIDDKSLEGDCLILPFDDEDLKCTSSSTNN